MYPVLERVAPYILFIIVFTQIILPLVFDYKIFWRKKINPEPEVMSDIESDIAKAKEASDIAKAKVGDVKSQLKDLNKKAKDL